MTSTTHPSTSPASLNPVAPTVPRVAPGQARRILLVVDGFFPTLGGAEAQVLLLARAFRERGHQVMVVAPALRPGDKAHEVVEGTEVLRITYPHVRLLGAVVLCWRFGAWLLKHRRDFDAVHIHMVRNLAAVAGLIRPWLGLPVAAKVSGAWEFDGGLLDPQLREKPFFRVLNWCVRRIDTIQCISAFTRDMVLQAAYPERMLRMIPNAVDTDRFVPHPVPAGLPHVAYVGRLRKVKGVYELIEAWATVVKAHPAKLLVAGDGPEREVLEARVRELGIEGSIEFLGVISDVPAVLRRSCLYVQPSYQEGMPNSVLEAMAAGLPIVATRISGNVDLVDDQDNGLLVPAGDAPALAQAMLTLLGEPPLAQRMGARSRERVVQQYGVDAVLAQLLTCYDEGRPRTEGGRA
jgi:glycosyltransferase involved in cell wall biosynthesis